MPKFTLMQRKLNLEQIEGKYSAFAKCHYALPVRLSKPLAKDGYGKVTVDGIEISRGKTFFMDTVIKMHMMLIPVGEVAREFDKEYTVSFSGFTAEDGSVFKPQSFKFKTLPRKQRDPHYDEHDKVALRAALEGMVLLKNEGGVLPLAADSLLNVFGAAQYTLRNSATGAGLINPRWQADFHQGVKEHSRFTVNEEISRLYERLQNVVPTEDELRKAKEKSDFALLFLSRTSGEFLDNKPIQGGYYLTDDEEAMIAAVSAVFEKTVAIINTGYPIDMRWMETYNIKAALYTGFAGMSAGYALMELLDGRVSPSGHLPDTWALDYYDYPSAANFTNYLEGDEVPGEKTHGVRLFYEEDIYMGYRYFDTFQKPVQYAFGHGLSYTEFGFDVTDCKADESSVIITASVKNTGKAKGKEVLQLYVGAPDGKLEKPRRVLIDFAKTSELKPGETETLTLSADARAFASYDEASSSYVLEAGAYSLWLGESLDKAEQIGSFQIAEKKTLKTVTPVARPVEDFHRMNKKENYVNRDSYVTSLDERFPVKAERKAFRPTPLKTTGKKKVSFAALKADPALLDGFVAQLSVDELCKLNVSTGADWYMPWGKGTAGGTPKLSKYGLPAIRVSDGNTGLNIVKPNIGFPSSCTVAASFSKELAREVGRVIGEESKENGIAVNLGPGMNLHRNILCGRHPEYFSEDPVLAGVMAGYHAKGIESTGIMATYKHLFCNNSETSRKGSHSIVSERALRELYFRVFEIALSIQKPGCVMTSYNALNGIYPTESAEILQTLVRGEWDFDGLIMTDWCSYDTIDPVEIVKAGTDWLTEGGGKYVKILKKAVRDGKLSADILRDNAKYVIAWVLNAT